MNSNVKLLAALNNGKLAELKEMLKANIREESAKGLGKKKQLTIINSILSSATKDFRLQKDRYIPFKDKYAFTDGHMVVFSNDNFGFEQSDSTIDFNSLIPSYFDESVHFNEAQIKVLVDLNKTVKNTDNITPIIVKDTKNDALLGLNPKYVAQLMQFDNVTSFKYNVNKNSHGHIKSPVFAMNENDEIIGLVLPVNITEAMAERFLNNPDVDLVYSDRSLEESILER